MHYFLEEGVSEIVFLIEAGIFLGAKMPPKRFNCPLPFRTHVDK
jgi:hypothetical protein